MGKNKIKKLTEVTIGDMVSEGKCISRIDEKVYFIEGVVPGDIVDIIISKDKKSFAEAYPVHFHKYSDLRSPAFCEHFGTCGGCKWQDLSYEKQLEFKQKQVSDALERIGKITIGEMLPILPSNKTQFYRNKLEFTFSNKRWIKKEELSQGKITERNALGFHIPRMFDKVLDINNCYLQPEPSNSIRNWLKAYALEHKLSFFDIEGRKGFLRMITIRTSFSTGEVMLILQVADDLPVETEALLVALKAHFPEVTSLYWVLNQKGNDTFHDLELNLYHGKAYIEEIMEGLRFRIGPKSFYQTNSEQAYELYKVTRAFADISETDVVYDLYTGTGTIANFVAKQAKKVVGIEYVEPAIVDAKINSEINGISNTSFYAGDMKDVLNQEFLEKEGLPSVIITDPPRAGMHPDVVQTLIKILAPKIVYVSCNPATQARDIQLLSPYYKVVKVMPVDMFPHTHHVENVALLTLK
jgi:23S rRNA (uracil1939-C5)-methyltransferase